MDFPKSVPGVGLVGGQFADENPALGLQGSLIPAAWGNAITQELLNVIQAAGLEPNEEQADQLLEAIRTLVPERSAFAPVSGTLALPATAFGIYALADGGAAATVTLPSTEELVDDTELLLFANHANTATVQVKAVTGQTVQGPAALMGTSTTAFMLPAGGDWVRLRSEKALGRWVVVASYASARMHMLDVRVSSLEGRQVPIGQGQTVQVLTSSRAVGATYTGDADQSIFVIISIRDNSSGDIYVDLDGKAIPFGDMSASVNFMNIFLMVPAGCTYRLRSPVGTPSIANWVEIRKP